MSCHSGRDYDAREYADTWTYVDKTLFGDSKKKKLRRAGKNSLGKKEVNTSPIIMYMEDYLALKARAYNPLDPSPEKNERPKHAVKIERFANKKPTVLDQYTKRVRQAQAGGGAKARAYDLRMEELDEVKDLKTKLRAMEVNEKLAEQQRQKKMMEDAAKAEVKRQDQELAKKWVEESQAEIRKEHRRRQKCVAHSEVLRGQRDRVRKMKVLEEERREQENKALRIQLERAEAKEQKEKRAVYEAQRKNAAELKLSNIRSQKYKQRRAEQERKNNLAIQAYNRKKEMAAAARATLQKEENAAREKEIARLRELQEKSNDKRAEEDQKRALAYQEQLILKREAEDRAKAEAQVYLRQQVLQERAKQIEQQKAARRQELQAEEEEVARTKAKFVQDTMRDMAREQQKAMTSKAHWHSVDVLKAQRAEDKANKQQEVRNWDKKFALEKGVYDHEVSVAYKRMLGEHSGKGHTVPKHFRDGAAEARARHAQDRKKAQQTRPLW